jgi:DNA-repair protein XRCC3
LYSSGRRVCPALGISWANCVNSRVFLSKGEECSENIMRKFRVVFAPHLPQFCSEFVISENGVFGVEMGQRNVV